MLCQKLKYTVSDQNITREIFDILQYFFAYNYSLKMSFIVEKSSVDIIQDVFKNTDKMLFNLPFKDYLRLKCINEKN